MSAADRYAAAYHQLSQEVHEARLIRPRYWFTWVMVLGWVLAMATLVTLIVVLGPTWYQLFVSVAIGVVMAQLGLLSHEAAHLQLFASRRWNEWTARILAGLLVGISYGWWLNKHNSHHGHPNQLGKDPDIDSRVLAFTPEASEQRIGLRAKLAKHQGWFFIPLLALEGLNLQVQSVKTLLIKPKVPHRVTELILIFIRHMVYFVIIFTTLPVGMAFASYGLQMGSFGLLLGGVFALNHIGRPTVAEDMRIDFLHRQVIMSRNIKDGPLVRFFMGGLQYQIEHHLFPVVPRPNLRAVQKIVRKYCSQYAIPYTERQVLEASTTVLGYLNQVGLKNKDPFICPLCPESGRRRTILKKLPALPALALCTALLSGCGNISDDAASDEPDPAPTTTAPSASADPNDDFQPLQVNMVAQSGTHFPDGVDGVEFGCSDTLVAISTVPIHADSTQDHVAAAIQFLLDDSQYYHGSPSVTNSLTLSETLELSSVEVDRNSVEIALTGDVVVQSECESHRIQAQMYGTAAATAQLEDVTITVNDTELTDVLGLEPFDTSQLSHPDDAR